LHLATLLIVVSLRWIYFTCHGDTFVCLDNDAVTFMMPHLHDARVLRQLAGLPVMTPAAKTLFEVKPAFAGGCPKIRG
jgi:hypothetical protein